MRALSQREPDVVSIARIIVIEIKACAALAMAL